MIRVYIAGLFESRHRLKHERDWIAKQPGYEVVSTWMEEESTAIVDDPVYYRMLSKSATRDLDEIDMANLLILDTNDVDCRGGREFEAGYAYSRGCSVWLVGPPKNIFHLKLARFLGWVDVRSYIARAQNALGVLE